MLTPGTTVTDNAIHSNEFGITATSQGASLSKNNIFGNLCGLNVVSNSPPDGTVLATNNFWGAATGPGTPQADALCGPRTDVAVVAPFATKAFGIKIPNP